MNRGRRDVVVESSLLVVVRGRVVAPPVLESLELVGVSLPLMSVVTGGLVLVIVEVVDVVVSVRELDTPGSR